MARYSEHETSRLYELASRWKTECLLDARSLLWEGEDVWSDANLAAFKKCFVDNPDESSDSFEEKFKRQLSAESASVTKLACELVLIYFIFPSSVSGNRKRQLIETIASWQSIAIPESGKAVLSVLDVGIGGPGLAYNTRRPFEIAYLAELAIKLRTLEQPEQAGPLTDHVALRSMMDALQGDASRQSRDIVLHILFPDRYERIASRGHKRLIADTFSELIEEGQRPDDIDDLIYEIRTRLEKLLPNTKLDFYWPPLAQCWYVPGESRDLEPQQGLTIKKQIIFYGPPGTGKTHEARETADRLVRRGLLAAWGPKKYFGDPDTVDSIAKQRVRRVQFHPGYSYEDLIRGLQLVDGGRTEYRNGVLLHILDALKSDPEELRRVPFVLILDEMNRADLSKVLGECFSLLEDREMPVQLAGQDNTPCEVAIPPNLFVVGTMNLIDQSLEQVDFALRRRFLWFMRGFDADQFLQIARLRWEKSITRDWNRHETEFALLSERAQALNRQITDHPSLGQQYEIGHTYFCDIIPFVTEDLSAVRGRQKLLFSKSGHAREETVGRLWRYSLEPLIEQYLSGTDVAETKLFIERVKTVLMQGTTL